MGKLANSDGIPILLLNEFVGRDGKTARTDIGRLNEWAGATGRRLFTVQQQVTAIASKLAGGLTTSTLPSSFTKGSVVFTKAGGGLDEDNTNFFWDDTNNYLGIGDNTPSTRLALGGTGSANGITLGDSAADPVNLYRSAANILKTDDDFTIGTMTLGSVLFVGTGGLVSQDNDNLFWDNINKELGIGVGNPSRILQVRGAMGLDGDTRVIASFEDTTAFAAGVGGGINFAGKYNAGGDIAGWAGINGVKENATTDNVAGALTFQTRPAGGNNTERVRLNSTGYLGVGSTNPLTKLHVITGTDTDNGQPTSWNNDRWFLVNPENTATSGGVGISYRVSTGIGYITSLAPGVAWKALVLQAGGGQVGILATAPSQALSIGGTTGNLNIDSNGKVLTYNAISTVSNGVPTEYATVDLTAQGAAIAATTVYAVPAGGAGMYRVSFVAKVTQVATTSSVLGGTNGFQVVYTDQDDSVVVTTPAGHLFNSTTASLALNTTQAVYSGVIIVNAKLSTNIQYSIDYTSVGGTPMQYNLHIKVEAL